MKLKIDSETVKDLVFVLIGAILIGGIVLFLGWCQRQS